MNRKRLIEILNNDKKNYFFENEKKISFILNNSPRKYFYKYIISLRKYNYYNSKKNILSKILAFIYFRKKNRIGVKVNLEIGTNDIGEDLKIHHQNIVINKNSKIGNHCILHGNNCVGNNGNGIESPILSDNVELGFGSSVIGDVILAKGIVVGANSIVTKSFLEEDIVIAGNPARKMRKK